MEIFMCSLLVTFLLLVKISREYWYFYNMGIGEIQ